MKPLPGAKAPELSAKTTSGGRWTLSERKPRSFTLIVAYRGHH